MHFTQRACRRFSRHLPGAVLAGARRTHRVVSQPSYSESDHDLHMKPGQYIEARSVCAVQAGRTPSDILSPRPDSGLNKLGEAINWEVANHYTNVQGEATDFAGFLVSLQ